jgi:hypothetical protein
MGFGIEVEHGKTDLEELEKILVGITGHSNSYGTGSNPGGDTMEIMRYTVSMIEDIWPTIQSGIDQIFSDGHNPVLFTKHYSVPLTFMVQLYSNTVQPGGLIHIFHVDSDDGDAVDWETTPAFVVPSESLTYFGVDLDAPHMQDGGGEYDKVLDTLKALLGDGEATVSTLED